jgi:hypothetical protein
MAAFGGHAHATVQADGTVPQSQEVSVMDRFLLLNINNVRFVKHMETDILQIKNFKLRTNVTDIRARAIAMVHGNARGN